MCYLFVTFLLISQKYAKKKGNSLNLEEITYCLVSWSAHLLEKLEADLMVVPTPPLL